MQVHNKTNQEFASTVPHSRNKNRIVLLVSLRDEDYSDGNRAGKRKGAGQTKTAQDVWSWNVVRGARVALTNHLKTATRYTFVVEFLYVSHFLSRPIELASFLIS